MVHTFAWVDKVLVMEINAKWVQSIKFEDENFLKKQRAVASKAQMPSSQQALFVSPSGDAVILLCWFQFFFFFFMGRIVEPLII